VRHLVEQVAETLGISTNNVWRRSKCVKGDLGVRYAR
jgi:hypothetical protein